MKISRWMLSVSQVLIVAGCGGRATGVLEPPPLVYVITTQGALLSFSPGTGEFSTIGTLRCPTTTPDDMPFSMAVDHAGTAYVAFFSGSLFQVDTLTAGCHTASGAPASGGVFRKQFGMAFAGSASDTLYLAGSPGRVASGSPVVLGSMDLTTQETTTLGVVTPSIYDAELTSDGDGELFAFYQVSPDGTAGAIGRIDRTTGQLLAVSELPGVVFTGGWAFAFWQGDFYLFTAPGGLGSDTTVQRFRPSDGSIARVATLVGLTVVGAGARAPAPSM